MAKHPTRWRVVDGGIQFKRHWKPIIHTEEYGPKHTIHAYQAREGAFGAILINTESGRVKGQSFMKPSVVEAIEYAKKDFSYQPVKE